VQKRIQNPLRFRFASKVIFGSGLLVVLSSMIPARVIFEQFPEHLGSFSFMHEFRDRVTHPKRKMVAMYLGLRVKSSLLMFNTGEVMSGLLSAQILYKLPVL
jgi:hypothetical protein